MPSEARRLAHNYHRWSASHAGSPLSAACTALREAAWATISAPLLQVLDCALGQAAGSLEARCAMRTSDNTSLLRLLEYGTFSNLCRIAAIFRLSLHRYQPPEPTDQPPPGGEARAGAGADSTVGVSEHTDFELVTLLHQLVSSARPAPQPCTCPLSAAQPRPLPAQQPEHSSIAHPMLCYAMRSNRASSCAHAPVSG